MEAMLEENVTVEILNKAIREATISLRLCPVFMGSAYKNKGIQPLLDAVVNYLPNPTDVVNKALDLDNHEEEVILHSDDDLLTVALAFKLEDGQYGQLTYIRVYQGKIRKGGRALQHPLTAQIRVGRLIRMHASTMEDPHRGRVGRNRGALRHRLCQRRHLLRPEAQLLPLLDVRSQPGHFPCRQAGGQEGPAATWPKR